MLTLIAAAAVLPSAYNIPAGTKLNYDMSVSFDGYLPIFSGTQGTAVVELGVLVEGEKADTTGTPRASSDLVSGKVSLNGAPLPFTIDNIKGFFPKTTISMSPQGKVLKTNAPDIKPPVALPGLDVKRFPEISYLPIEFPAENVEIGKSWTFKRVFGGNEMTYTATPSKMDGDTLTIDVKVNQTYVTLENDSGSLVEKEAEAYAKVSTVVTGDGKIVFDTKRGIATDVAVDMVAKSDVKTIKSGTASKRELKTSLKVKLNPKPVTVPKSTGSSARFIGSYQLPMWATSAIDSAQQWAVSVGIRIMAMILGGRQA